MKLSQIKPKPKVGSKALLKRPPKTRLLVDLSALRKDRGVTIRDVEKATGIPNPVVCQTELGCTPALETALRIAAFVELPVEKIWALKKAK